MSTIADYEESAIARRRRQQRGSISVRLDGMVRYTYQPSKDRWEGDEGSVAIDSPLGLRLEEAYRLEQRR